MKLVKSKLSNRMGDGFLTSYLITYIEKDIAQGFDVFWLVQYFIVTLLIFFMLVEIGIELQFY
ncbi:hypothetical protein ACSBR2_005753 [Camellia fascicularis]